MIVTLDKNNKEQSLPLVDFHTHIGRVKIETTKGSSQRVNMPINIIRLYEKLQYELHKRISQDPDNYYVTLPSTDKISRPLYPILKDILDLNGKKARGWIVDQVVSFPFNDIFHKQTVPKFVKSNQFVRHQLYSFDYCFRFIPFCRCDVTDEGAEVEVRNSVKAGMRGLKLHPLSQGWIDKIISLPTKRILQTAGELNIPVIFDVPNKGVALDITSVSEEVRVEGSNQINVVLGHVAFDYSSEEIFECIQKDGMYAETSGMRGKDVEIFFNKVMEVRGWENKILFGTDSNYFGVLQAADFITFLLSYKFLDLLEKREFNIEPIVIAAKILGWNALRIIPKSWNRNNYYLEKDKISKTSANLIGEISNFNKILKKYLSHKENFAMIDFAKKHDEDYLYQIITFGHNGKRNSYVVEIHPEDKKLILSTPPSDFKENIMFLEGRLRQTYESNEETSLQELTEQSLLGNW